VADHAAPGQQRSMSESRFTRSGCFGVFSGGVSVASRGIVSRTGGAILRMIDRIRGCNTKDNWPINILPAHD